MKIEIVMIEGSVHERTCLMIQTETHEEIGIAGIDTDPENYDIDLDGRWKVDKILEDETRDKIYQAGPYSKYYSHYFVTEELIQKIKDLKKEK